MGPWPHEMILPDYAKLLLLFLITTASLSTLLTSPSITMGNAKMRVLSPQPQQFCTAPRKRARECENAAAAEDNNKDGGTLKCNYLTEAVHQCEKMVERAYRSINLGGCPFQIKSLTLCEDEWCHNVSPQGIKSCQDECAQVRRSLATCVEQRVIERFRWNGLNEDGTTT